MGRSGKIATGLSTLVLIFASVVAAADVPAGAEPEPAVAAAAADPIPSNCTPATNGGDVTVTCEFTAHRGDDLWTVPSGVRQLRAQVRGAQGGNGTDDNAGDPGRGGAGSLIDVRVNVTEGQQLQVQVGSQGGNARGNFGGWPDGGNGGATPSSAPDDSSGCGGGGSSRLRSADGSWTVIAAGGGGCGGKANGKYGVDGGATGQPGSDNAWQTDGPGCQTKGRAGGGATGAGPGAGGATGQYLSGTSCREGESGYHSEAGRTWADGGRGGNGGDANGGNRSGSGGGGGGGYNGGGGGGGGNDNAGKFGGGAGGGGGVDKILGSFSGSVLGSSGGANNGNGRVTISYTITRSTLTLGVTPRSGADHYVAGTPLELGVTVESTSTNVPTGDVPVQVTAGGRASLACTVHLGPIEGSPARATGSCTFTPIHGGWNSFTASYGGNGGVAGSVDVDGAVVEPMVTSTVVTSNSTGTELTATVNGNSADVDLSGTVTFAANGTAVPLCTDSAVTDQHDGSATVTCEVTPTPGADIDYTAAYAGNADAAASTSAPFHVNVDKAATTTAIAIGESSLSYGQTATATATVRATGATVTYDGPVDFVDTGDDGAATTVCAAVPLDTNGQARCTWLPGGGDHHVVASFAGGSQTLASTSPPSDPFGVARVAPSVTLDADPPGGALGGQSVTLTATAIAAGNPLDGTTARFADGGAPITGCAAVAVVDGVASCSFVPSVGDHTFTVAVDSTANTLSGTVGLSGASAVYHVGFAPSTTTIEATSPSPLPPVLPAGAAVTATARVAATGPTPTGTVAFADNGRAVPGCAAQDVTAGAATCTWVPAAGQSHVVTAAYGGDASVAPSSTVTPLSFTTGRHATTIGLTVEPGGTTGFGTLTTLHARVTSDGPTPGGTVTFTDGDVPVAACGAVAAPVATCSIRAVPGAHTYRAVYSGDAAHDTATSAPVTATTEALATVVTATARQSTIDTITLSATVAAPGADSFAPVGTVTFVEGAASCSANLERTPTGAAGACQLRVDPGVDHAFTATYTPDDPVTYQGATGSVSYVPVAACSPGLAAFVDRLGTTPVTVSAGPFGSVTVTAGTSTPCNALTSLDVSVDASLSGGTLTATGVVGSVTVEGFCLESGTFSLPSNWHAPTVTITTPICFSFAADGTIDGVVTGGLTATTPAGSFPFVAFPNAPPTSAAIGFASDAGGTTLHISFVAGPVENPAVVLDVTVGPDGGFTGDLTTPGLSVFGSSLAGLHVTVTGGAGNPIRFDGGMTLGPVDLAPGLTLATATVGVSSDGFTVSGTALAGAAGRTATLDVAGTVGSSGDWSLTLRATDAPVWEPVSGLQIRPEFTGSVDSVDGVVSWSVTAGGADLAVWNPAPGATVTMGAITLGNAATECPAVPGGADDLAMAFSGTLDLDGTTVDASGCVDLDLGTFHLEGAATSVPVVPGMQLTDVHLTVDAAVSGAFTVVGDATAAVTTGTGTATVAVAFDLSSDGTLVIGGTVDLGPWGAPVTGYIAYASGAVRGFDTHDPTVGDAGRVDLAAGLTAVAVWTPSPETAEILRRAGLTLGAGGTVSLSATLGPGRAVTFHAALAAPGGMPFVTLPGGATVTGATLDFAGGTLTFTVDATVPMPGGAAPASAHLEVTIGNGTFSGTMTVTGLVLFGQRIDLTGTVTGTRPAGSLIVSASVSAHLPGPIALPGVAAVTFRDLTVSLGTDGIRLAGTASVAGRGDLTISGTLTSLTDWSLSVTSTTGSWTPVPGVTIDARVSGTIQRTDAGITFELAATGAAGELATFTPVDGLTIAIHSIRLGNAVDVPHGCRVDAVGDVWLWIDGTTSLHIGSASGTAAASGCFDLTTGSVALTADASAMRLELLDGHVVIAGPKVTITRTIEGYAVDASVDFEVHFPTGGTFASAATLSLRSGGVFVVGVRANLSAWLGSAGASAYLYYSNTAIRGYDTGDPSIGKVDLVSGVTFAVKVTLPGFVADELSNIGLASPGGAAVSAVGSVDFENTIFRLTVRFDAGVGGQKLFTTSSGVSLALDSGHLTLTVSKGSVAFGLGLAVTLHMPAADGSGGADDVPLMGELSISNKQLAVSLQLGRCDSGTGWHDAFGVAGLTVQCAALQGGLSLEGPPLPSFGMMGTITSLPTRVARATGYVNGSPMAFAFNLDPFLLSVSVGTQDSGKVALRPLTMIGRPDAMEVEYAALYLSPTGATIGDQVYPAGIGFGFQAAIAGVSMSVLARIDVTKPSVSFDAHVDRFTIAPLTIGPVDVHFRVAAPTTFSFTFDGRMHLGPTEVDLGAVLIGGSLDAAVHVGVGTSAISARLTAAVSAYVAAYVPHAVCYYEGVAPYPCDFAWDATGFDFELGETGVDLDSDGLTVTFDGYSLTLPFDGSGPSTQAVSRRGERPDAKPAVAAAAPTPKTRLPLDRPPPDPLVTA